MHKTYKPERILSYVVASDTGLAPNITGDICTLAVCKTVLRRIAQQGKDWIVGLSTATGDKNGRYKIIYAMQVEEILSFEDYFNDPRFQGKKPNKTNPYGDNIYKMSESGQLVEAFTKHAHTGQPNLIRKDLNTPVVLIAKNFWFFGDKAPMLPAELHDKKISIPDRSRRGHRVTSHTEEPEVIDSFVSWLTSNWQPGIYGAHRDLPKTAHIFS